MRGAQVLLANDDGCEHCGRVEVQHGGGNGVAQHLQQAVQAVGEQQGGGGAGSAAAEGDQEGKALGLEGEEEGGGGGEGEGE